MKKDIIAKNMMFTINKIFNNKNLISLNYFNFSSSKNVSEIGPETINPTIINSNNKIIKNSLPLTKFDINKFKRNIVQVEEIDHPCFKDLNYVKRKKYIQDISNSFNIGDEIPIIDYKQEEIAAWNYVTSKIFPKMRTNCCKEINKNFDIFSKEIGISTDQIPQLRDISNILEKKTGFTICPVGGLLEGKHFLNALAFKVFCCTQFIRPLERADLSGEPDVLHEIIGHTAMFADENFAQFSQDIGIASLGASDEDIKVLSNIYWFTVEYGLVYEYETLKDEADKNLEKRKIKIYGGGITPSVFEIDYALSMKANYWSLDFEKMQTAYYDYVNLSTNYFVADDFESMKDKFRKYSKSILDKNNWFKFEKDKNKVLILNN